MGSGCGNKGNLMQHWTFFEVLKTLNGFGFDKLHLTTTHSMAPRSTVEDLPAGTAFGGKKSRLSFVRCKERLLIRQETNYEKAWLSLSPERGYPSTALFATKGWEKGKISIALCETDGLKVREIAEWLTEADARKHFSSCALFPGDWRNSLRNFSFWRKGADCLYIEMDPMRYSLKDRKRKDVSANVHPNDLRLLVRHLRKKKASIVLQISTYSTLLNQEKLEEQKSSIARQLAEGGFDFQGEVRVGKTMASFIFSRNISMSLGHLQDAFTQWLEGIK
jgi:hypothetical protein